jgi:hypothetical protein
MRGETIVRLTKRGLRIEAGGARRCDEVEQELAEELLIVDVERQVETRRLDFHARGALEHPLRCEKRWELRRNAAEQGLPLVVALLPTLDLLPLHEKIATDDLLSSEHVRMPANELLVQPARDLVRVEGSLLTPDLGVNRDLEQKIAELVAEPRWIAGIERGERFVGLLEQVRSQRRVRLFAIPRAAVWRAKPLGDAHDGVERGEVRKRLERREHEKMRFPEVALRVGERRRAIGIDQRDRVIGGVTRLEETPVDGAVESDGDGAQRRKRMPVEAARWDEVDAGGPPREDGGEGRRATRTRGRG